MKIMQISDIHRDFETLDRALKPIKDSEADVVAVTGDLIGGVFNEKEQSRFIDCLTSLRGILPQLYEQTKGRVSTIHETANFLASNPGAPLKLMKKVADYLDFERIAEQRMLSQYEAFERRFKTLEELGKKVLLVPGNWDAKCLDDVLEQRNIHNKDLEFGGVKFAGYGGAKGSVATLPIDLLYLLDEDELYSHLTSCNDAEVVLTHAMPRGPESENRHFGSPMLLAYMNLRQPSLILAGHSHTPKIIRDEATGTFISNSGNLGRYQKQTYGTFLELDLDDNLFVHPRKFYRVNLLGQVEATDFE